MLDFNNNYDFNALNDESIKVVDSKQKIKSTAESFNPYDNTQQQQQPPPINNNNIYAQDGLPGDTMLPTHAPNNNNNNTNNIFPGMIPNVPLVTDPIEIAQNAKLAAQSNLKPTIAEFIPGQINNSFVNNTYSPIHQFNATQILQYNTNANIQNQQWINDNNNNSIGFKLHNKGNQNNDNDRNSNINHMVHINQIEIINFKNNKIIQ